MQVNDDYKFKPTNYQNRKHENILHKRDNSIAIYTVLCILRRMKTQLGLEAMLEYKEKYLEVIEDNNPRVKAAVEKAVRLMDVERIYRKLVGVSNE